MLKKLSKKISALLVANNIVQIDQQDAYIYGLEIFLQQVVFFFIIFILALITRTILLSFIFVVVYKVLRQYTGGFHCKTSGKCLIVSVLTYIPLIFLYYFNNPLVDIIVGIVALISSFVIFVFAPVESENKSLDQNEKRKYHIFSILITIITIIVMSSSFLLEIKSVFYAVSWSLSADAVFISITLRLTIKSQ